jgi:hypothetical protein
MIGVPLSFILPAQAIAASLNCEHCDLTMVSSPKITTVAVSRWKRGGGMISR